MIDKKHKFNSHKMYSEMNESLYVLIEEKLNVRNLVNQNIIHGGKKSNGDLNVYKYYNEVDKLLKLFH